VSIIDEVAGRLMPAAAYAFEKTGPVRQFLHDAKDPIPNGELVDTTDRLFNMSDGEPVSPLTLASRASPATGGVVDVVRGVCDA
jgi:hypothetical protein